MKKVILSVIFTLLINMFLAGALPYGGVVLSYTSEKDFYRPGESGEIFLTVSNPTTYSLGNIDVELSSGSYIELKENFFSLDNLPAGSSQQIGIIFTINSSAQPTISYIKVHVEYKDFQDNQKENDIVIPIKIFREPILKVYALGIPEIKIGKAEKICFEIVNYGGIAKDISISIDSDAFSFSPPERFFDSLEKVKDVCFVANPITTEIGNYQIKVSLNYKDSLYESSYSDSFTFWTNLSGKIELTVYIESYSEEDNAVNIVFSNSGNEDIKALHVKLSSDIDIAPKEIYIGDLEKDDYDSERVFLSPKAGKHVINITARFRDSFEREYEKSYSLEVFIPQREVKEEFNSLYIIIPLLVVVFVAYFLRKRK